MYPYSYTIIGRKGEKEIIETDAPERIFNRVIDLVVEANAIYADSIIEVLRGLNHKAEYFATDKTYDLQTEARMKEVMNRYYTFSGSIKLLDEGFVMAHPASSYDYIVGQDNVLYGFFSNDEELHALTPDEVRDVSTDKMEWYVVDIRDFLKEENGGN
jgi:hypothetical protein